MILKPKKTKIDIKKKKLLMMPNYNNNLNKRINLMNN